MKDKIFLQLVYMKLIFISYCLCSPLIMFDVKKNVDDESDSNKDSDADSNHEVEDLALVEWLK